MSLQETSAPASYTQVESMLAEISALKAEIATTEKTTIAKCIDAIKHNINLKEEFNKSLPATKKITGNDTYHTMGLQDAIDAIRLLSRVRTDTDITVHKIKPKAKKKTSVAEEIDEGIDLEVADIE